MRRDSNSCSASSETLAEPLAGTAATARAWLCLEQSGPWGREALLESRLDAALGSELSARAEASGVRVQLIRRPGERRDAARAQRVYLANADAGRSWLRAGELTDPAELLDLDFDRIAAGAHDGWGGPAQGPVLLVCTNGRRDQCCAVHGRALAAELAKRYGDSVWETSHTGGHRFAPAAVLLPSGYTYGRLDAHGAEAALSAAEAGKVTIAGCRGRSAWSHRGQAAELAVREFAGEYLIDSIRVIDGLQVTETTHEVLVRHEDGRAWTVTTSERELDPPRPNSCGKGSVRPVSLVVEGIRQETEG